MLWIVWLAGSIELGLSDKLDKAERGSCQERNDGMTAMEL